MPGGECHVPFIHVYILYWSRLRHGLKCACICIRINDAMDELSSSQVEMTR